MNNRYKILGLGLALGLQAQAALAAPFCVQAQGISPECHYYDANECRKRASQLKGMCGVNRSEITIRPGVGKFCLVDSSRNAMCSYADRGSCNDDAVRNGGVCIEAEAPGVQQDPYQQDPNRKY